MEPRQNGWRNDCQNVDNNKDEKLELENSEDFATDECVGIEKMRRGNDDGRLKEPIKTSWLTSMVVRIRNDVGWCERSR